MKKTFPVNINGKIYYIDEDAYTLLQNYLQQLRATFPGEEGAEILSDIESRISELFDERLETGASVIILANVNEVIGIMGRPEELGGDEDETCPKNEAGAVPPPIPDAFIVEGPVTKKLYRDERHKVFGGVLAGFGQYMNWDVTVLRILVVVLALCTKLWPLVLVYMIAWLVIPPARTPRQILEMMGRPVTLGTVGQTVIDSSTPPPAPVPDGNSFSNFINTAFMLIGKCLLAFIAFVAGITSFVTVVIGLVLITGMICLFTANAPGILNGMDVSLTSPYLEGWGITLVMFAVALPMLALFWAGCTVVFRAAPMSRGVLLAGLVLEILLIIGASVLLNLDGADFFSALLPATTIGTFCMA